MKALIIITLLAIVASLGHALFTMSSGPTDSKRMVQALTVRVGLSVALFAFLMIGWYLGLLSPHAVGH
ncbi:MAG TPA: twin transmembrane helix small protein [Steroidobacteraceae bacterium]|nr:twin transmembrane helix small protein [Steroidobacteraceae bacterium]